MKNVRLVLVLLVIAAACTQKKTEVKRPADPWVFRSVLDEQARMVTAALSNEMWVAYSAQTGELYKAWKGGVKFDGAVYTTVHGPQPTSNGYAYFQQPATGNSWVFIKEGKEIVPKVQFRGHRISNGSATFSTELTSGSDRVLVRETPEYTSRGNQNGLVRTFEVEGAAEGLQVGLKTRLTSLQVDSDYSTDGTFTVSATEEKEYTYGKLIEVQGLLVLNDGDATELKVFYHPGFDKMENAEAGAALATESAGQTLIFNSDCKTCHNEQVKTIGPAYISVARKYADNDESVALLASKVIKGGGGVWGDIPMTPHASLSEADASEMIRYILSLDDNEDKGEAGAWHLGEKTIPIRLLDSIPQVSGVQSGLAGSLYLYSGDVPNLEVIMASKPIQTGKVPVLHVRDVEDFEIRERIFYEFRGAVNIPKDGSYSFRLVSDDGSQLFIDDKLAIDHCCFHGPDPKDGEVYLTAGAHPVRILYFQAGGGAAISFQWFNKEIEKYQLVPESMLSHTIEDYLEPKPYVPEGLLTKSIPGDGTPLLSVHPAFDLFQARPEGFRPKVGGIDFFSNGNMVVSTWDSVGAVYLLENVTSTDPSQIKVKRIAAGLAEPLGLKVVDDTVYVMQKQELTQLIDHDGDMMIDEYRTFSNAWRVSANFHEFGFGLVYKDGYFYGTLATAILPGGASAQPQIPDRGKVVKISRKDGSLEFMAHGLRTPNGIGIGVDGEIFVADNQGDWLPSSKILHITQGSFYGSRSVDPVGTATLKEKLPVVWLPQDEIGNSPTEPAIINVGPYAGQMIHGEVTHGGVKRVFVEKVKGEYQGAVFRFIQGLEAGVNRLDWGPDGSLYIGGVGSSGNWSQTGKKWYGLQRLKYNDKPVFEMLAVRAKSNGFEIEFTQPVKDGQYLSAADFLVQQWYYKPTPDYGGPKLDLKNMKVKSFHLSDDRRKVFMEMDGLEANHVVYFRIVRPFVGEGDLELWTTEAWYTLNNIPDEKGFVQPYVVANNTLTPQEESDGWKLLFDGKTTNGWRNFKKETIGRRWKVLNGELVFEGKGKNEQNWNSSDGGDIITDAEYENYELSLEWKISEAGNSGIIYNIVEADKYEYTWHTGMEMQVTDNVGHPDGQFDKHRAGDLYDLIACKFVTVNPAGQWNRVRLKINKGHVEHWLNGYKVVEYDLGTPAWEALVKGSKFVEMPDFGKATKGRIGLQDHGDRVAYRNIKIKAL